MKKLSSYAFVIVLSLGATALLASSGQTPAPVQGVEEQLSADGAYRDGLYVGRLAAEHGQKSRPTIGRWSTDRGRSTFTAGYRRGYNESLVRAEASAEHAQLDE